MIVMALLATFLFIFILLVYTSLFLLFVRIGKRIRSMGPKSGDAGEAKAGE